MSGLGDFPLSAVLDFDFWTQGPTGAGQSLSGGTVSVYKGSSTTESTAGVTLTADFDGRTGFNHVTIDTSADGTFYSAGGNFTATLTAGTVGGVSAVGAPLAYFTLNAGAALRPTVASRTLDVNTTGGAGIDWGNIDNVTTAVDFTQTTIKNLDNAPSDSSGVTTLLGRLTSTRAGYLDNLSGGAVALAATALSTAQWTNGRAALIDNLDVAVSTRMATFTLPTNFAALGISAAGKINEVILTDTTTNLTNAGPDSSGVTTLLGRLTSTRAGYLDNLNGGPVALAASLPANFSSMLISAAGYISVLGNLHKGVALAGFTFQMTDSTTHAPKTGLTVTGQISQDGGSYAPLTNAVTEVGSGTYAVNLAASDTNGNVLNLMFTATGADQVNIVALTFI